MTMKKSFVALALTVAAVFALSGCMPSHSNAQLDLMWLLNDDRGDSVTAEQLVNLKNEITLWDRMRGIGVVIDFPLTDANTLPRDSVVYIASDCGSQMTFHLGETREGSPVVGKVTMKLREDTWGKRWDRDFPPEELYLESRGKGVYTVYSYKKNRDDTVASELIDSVGYSKWREPRVLFVYPGADSIVVSRGSKETLHTYHLAK